MKQQITTSGRKKPNSLILYMYCPGHRDRTTSGRFSRCTGCRTRVFRADPVSYRSSFEKGA